MLGSKSRGLLDPEHKGVKNEKAKTKVQAHVTGRVNARITPPGVLTISTWGSIYR
jgi:hypothetical protein